MRPAPRSEAAAAPSPDGSASLAVSLSTFLQALAAQADLRALASLALLLAGAFPASGGEAALSRSDVVKATPGGQEPLPEPGGLPSDHYLWLTGQGGKLLRSEVKEETLPVRGE